MPLMTKFEDSVPVKMRSLNYRGLTNMVARIDEWSRAKGWRSNPPRPVKRLLMLVVTEIAEAAESFRTGSDFPMTDKGIPLSNFEEEMADVGVRLLDMFSEFDLEINEQLVLSWADNVVFDTSEPLNTLYDLCQRVVVNLDQASLGDVLHGSLGGLFWISWAYQFDLMKAIEIKMDYNDTRPFKHGKHV